jgi:hypothetical protein
MASIDQDGEFQGWALLELMGHRKLAGYCEPVMVAGAALLKVTVPTAGEHLPAYTTYVGGPSIYSLTPTDEQTARDFVTVHKPRPVEAYSIQMTANLAAKRELERLQSQARLQAPAGDTDDATGAAFESDDSDDDDLIPY